MDLRCASVCKCRMKALFLVYVVPQASQERHDSTCCPRGWVLGRSTVDEEGAQGRTACGPGMLGTGTNSDKQLLE